MTLRDTVKMVLEIVSAVLFAAEVTIRFLEYLRKTKIDRPSR